ncbi:MAG: glycosyltransferase [Cytophagales bacterium]|nr:glycosyltransferase [Cytophaga sp.]
MKPKIIHFIDSFSKGGAEVLLAGIIPYFEEYTHYIIYLTPTQHSLKHLLPEDIHIECLNYKGLKNIFSTLSIIRQRFKEINPDIIHTHLIFSTLFTRLLLPENTRLITSYHGAYYRVHYITKSARIKRSILCFIDRLSYKKDFVIIHASRYLQLVNDKDVGISNSTVLYNYVEDRYFKHSGKGYIGRRGTHLSLIAVGNLKTEKNYILILQAIKQVKHIPLTLEIYGEGIDRSMLQQYINDNALPVTLKGGVDAIEELLPLYDLFIQASTVEGFGISVAEAMAIGIPVLLSDIDTFKEITDNKALFFTNMDSLNLAKKIEELYHQPSLMMHSVEACLSTAQRYKKYYYLERLRSLYAEQLSIKNKRPE